MSTLKKILILIVVAAFVLLGGYATLRWQAQRIAELTSVQLLDTGVSVQAVLQSQRQRGQEWETSTIARDAGFVSYISQALAAGTAIGSSIDSASIRDQLAERRAESYLSSVSLLDTTGHTLVASGNVDLEQRDYSTTPLIKDVLARQTQASAIWSDKTRLSLVTVVPVLRGTVVQALLMSQEPIDKTFVDALGKTSHADAAVLQRDGTTLRLVASTLSSHDALQLQGVIATMPQAIVENISGGASSAGLMQFDFGDRQVAARASALFNSPASALLVALVPAAHGNALIESLGLPIVFAAAAVLVLFFAVLVLFWLQFLRPLTKLGKLAERGAFGDHELLPIDTRSPDFVRLATAINHLIKEMLGRRRKSDWR